MEYTIGNTVALTVQFYERSDGITPVDVDTVTFKVYDHNRVQIGTTVNIGLTQKVSIGRFTYNYTIPNNPPYIDVEWTGVTTTYNDVSRDRLYVRWAENDTNVLPTPTLTVGTNTYISLADAETYFESRLGSEIWNDSSDIDKAKALIKATKSIDRLIFKGSKQNYEQTLQFPRFINNKVCDLFINETTEIPIPIEEAVCEEAIALLNNQINPNQRIELQRQGVKSISFGHASETYALGYINNILLSKESTDILKPYIANSVNISRGR